MTTPQEKAQCVTRFIKTKSDIQAQRNFIAKYVKRASARQSIRNWHKQFLGTGTLLLKPRSGWSKTSEKGILCIRQSFSRSPNKVHHHCFRSGYVKDVVYRTKVKDISDLKERITTTEETTDEEMLRRTWTEI